MAKCEKYPRDVMKLCGETYTANAKLDMIQFYFFSRLMRSRRCLHIHCSCKYILRTFKTYLEITKAEEPLHS